MGCAKQTCPVRYFDAICPADPQGTQLSVSSCAITHRLNVVLGRDTLVRDESKGRIVQNFVSGTYRSGTHCHGILNIFQSKVFRRTN